MIFKSRNNDQLKWQETEHLLRILFSRINLLLVCPDNILDNNIRAYVRALRDGQSIHELHPLMQDISNRIHKLRGSALIGYSGELNAANHSEESIRLVFDVLMTLLDNINFPENVAERIQHIRDGLKNLYTGDMNLQLVSAITALATILDDIFERVDKDKKKIDNFLLQINKDLQSMDQGITETHKLHTQKQELEESIDFKVTSEVHEMESLLSSRTEIEVVKKSVHGSLQAIRSHMETFKQEEQERNRRSRAVTDELRYKLDKMEKECNFLKQQVLEKHEQVLSDPLTGIRNRLAYEEAIQMECDRYNRYGRPLSLMMLDIDHFKQVNDNYGHGSGDKVLQMIAKLLASNIRNVDFLARYGGEEFIIILPELTAQDARLVGQKICKAVAAQQFDIGGHQFKVTISAGITRMNHGDTPESLFERADSALYLAKERGRNRCEIE